MRISWILCVLVGLGGSAPPKLMAAPKQEPFEEAIDRALDYLHRVQMTNGAWSTRGTTSDPAITSLCVMAFLSAGHVPGEGKYGPTIEKGIRYVASQQQKNGSFTPMFRGFQEMYYHGICTLMMAEAIGMMPDKKEAKALKERLESAIQLVRKAQRSGGLDDGGWRYQVQGFDADISVTGWQLMALRAAKNVGCDVPPDGIERAVKYIKACRDTTTGGYRYTRYGQVTVPCTGTSLLSLMLCEKDHLRSEEAIAAANYIKKNPLDPNRQHFFYGIYYTSQAMFQMGDTHWGTYRKNLHELLLTRYPPQAGGFWIGRSPDDSTFGPNYCTAMAILALTVEYRFLPIYQRTEEPGERTDSPKK